MVVNPGTMKQVSIGKYVEREDKLNDIYFPFTPPKCKPRKAESPQDPQNSKCSI